MALYKQLDYNLGKVNCLCCTTGTVTDSTFSKTSKGNALQVGSGTNPVLDANYTTSNYFVLDLGATDKIANIRILDGVKQ